MKSISLFVDNGTYLTKVHPFTKLMYIAAAISIPLISGRLWMFGVFIAVSLLVLASGKILKKTLPLIAFSFTILLTIFLIHGLFNQKNVNVLFQVVGLKFYREGISAPDLPCGHEFPDQYQRACHCPGGAWFWRRKEKNLADRADTP